MRLYMVDCTFTPTLAEAKEIAKSVAGSSIHDCQVDRVEVETTRENVARMLNGFAGTVSTIEAAVFVARGNRSRS